MEEIQKWLIETYEPGQIAEIRKYGCEQGVPGLIYYHETDAFYARFEEEVWDVAGGYADNLGRSIWDVMNTHGTGFWTHGQFAQRLVWLAVDVAASELTESYTT